MSRGIGSKDIPPQVLKGMRIAAKNWDRLHGSWADKAPEYWFTVQVALQLQKALDEDKNWISLEGNVRKSLNAAGPRRRGRPHAALRNSGRCDILVERANGKPFAAIEVKRNAYVFSEPLGKDIDRLAQMLAKRSSLSIGCLALYSSARSTDLSSAKDVLKERFNTFLRRSKDRCEASSLIIKSVSFVTEAEDSDDCWGVQCISLARS